MRRLLLACCLCACAPELPPVGGKIEGPRLIDVRVDPPELGPGEVAHLAVVIAEDDPALPAPSFVQCTAPPPITELGPVSCADGGEAIELGAGRSLELSAGFDICQTYGPDPLKPEQRPRDPDATGGFYLPIVVRFQDQTAALRIRLRCDLTQLPIELSRQLREQQVPNRNPRAERIVRSADGQSLSLVLAPDAQDTYLLPSPDRSSLISRAEVLTTSWYWSSGELSPARAPAASSVRFTGNGHVWAVLRDDRGGSSVVEGDL